MPPLTSTCGCLSLQVGVVTFSGVMMSLSFIILNLTLFNYQASDTSAVPVARILVLLFVIIFFSIAALSFIGAYMEHRGTILFSLGLMVILITYWLIMCIFSMTVTTLHTSNVCIKKRCAPSLWIVDLDYSEYDFWTNHKHPHTTQKRKQQNESQKSTHTKRMPTQGRIQTFNEMQIVNEDVIVPRSSIRRVISSDLFNVSEKENSFNIIQQFNNSLKNIITLSRNRLPAQLRNGSQRITWGYFPAMVKEKIKGFDVKDKEKENLQNLALNKSKKPLLNEVSELQQTKQEQIFDFKRTDLNLKELSMLRKNMTDKNKTNHNNETKVLDPNIDGDDEYYDDKSDHLGWHLKSGWHLFGLIFLFFINAMFFIFNTINLWSYADELFYKYIVYDDEPSNIPLDNAIPSTSLQEKNS